MIITNTGNIYNNYGFCQKKNGKNFSFQGALSETRKNMQVSSNEIYNRQRIDLNSKKEENFYDEFVQKKGKVTIDQYRDIAKNHLNVIAKAYQAIYSTIEGFPESNPDIFAKCALILKNYFDNNFENYEIISIGTSPALISEALQSLGCDVIFAPITSLRDINEKNIISKVQNDKSCSNIKKLLNYIKEKTADNENKNYILLDFSSTGTTIRNLKTLLIYFNGLNSEKIYSCSLYDELNQLSSNNKDLSQLKLTANEMNILYNDLITSAVETVSNVPHFHIYDNQNRFNKTNVSSKGKTDEELFLDFDNYSQPNARIYSLLTIHSMQKYAKKIR